MNAHFVNDGVPWTAEDLLGRGDRKKRMDDNMRSKIMTSRIIAASKDGAIPEWALEIERERGGKKPRVN